jgi:hypothetical protein
VFAPGSFAQQSVYRAPDVPSVVWLVATAYTSALVVKPDEVTEVVDDKPTYVFTPSTSSPHAFADSRMRITFVVLKPTPESCNEHVSVKVQSVVRV